MKILRQPDSNSMTYLDEGAGRPLVLVHGWGVSGALFDSQVKAFSDRCRVIVPDLRGHANSGEFSEETPFSVFADDLYALIDLLELHSVCLVGWSMGAMVCWDLMQRYPDLDVAGLISIDMVPRLYTSPEWPFGLRDENDHGFFKSHAALMKADWQAYCDLFVPRIFARGTDTRSDALVAHTKRIALENRAAEMAHIWACLGEQDFRQTVGHIEVPSRIVSGKLSQLYGVAAAKWLASAMPSAQLEVFEQSGHAPHLEEPELFNAMLGEFLDELDGIHALKNTEPRVAG